MRHKLSISKDEINRYPQFKFEGKIEVIESKESALIAIEVLKNENFLGFDTETRASFKKGECYDVSLLQLATQTTAYLFRLNKFDMFQALAAILEDPNIFKIGVGIKDDIKALKKLLPFKEEGFVELIDIAKKNKIENFGLRALTAIFLHKRLSKRAKTSNWERKHLTPEQIHYAACDAVVGLQIYQAICQI